MTPAPKAQEHIAQQLEQHTDFVTRLARRLVADQQLADDAAQETMLAAMTAPPRQDVNVRGWLVVAVRRAVSRLRARVGRSASTSNTHDLPDAAHGTPLERATSLELHRDLVQAVLALEQPYRDAIRLRFLEDLSIDELAERTSVPRNTARSHVRRGLEQLRGRLDRRHGKRAVRLALVTPLARRQLGTKAAASAAFTTSTTLLATGITMKKLLVAAVAVLALATLGYRLWTEPRDASPTAPGNGDARLATAAQGAGAEPGSSTPATAQQPATERTEVADASGPDSRRQQAGHRVPADDHTMLLVDTNFRPLEGLRMRRTAPNAVRWQGGDVGWIAGPAETLRLSPSRVKELRADASSAQAFFAARQYPKQWRATVLGEPLPEQEVATDASGAFSFAPTAVAIRDVELVESGWTLLSRPERSDLPFVGCPEVQLAGRVVASDGQHIAGATLTIDTQRALPESMRSELLRVRRKAMRSGRDGHYLLQSAPHADGVLLRVRAPGYAEAVMPVPPRSLAAMDITLWPESADAQRILDGVVVDPSGEPIADAEVIAGRVRARTGEDGTFELTVASADADASLTVIAASWQCWHRPRFGQRLLDDANAGRRLRIQLEGAARTLRLRVVGPDGQPAAGCGCNLVDPTLLGYSFTSVEARAGARKRSVPTDASGRLQLTGLSDRSYFVRIWNPKTGFVHVEGPLRPSADERTVMLPAAAAPRRLTGRCVEADASAVGGAVLRLAWCTYVTRSGGTMWQDLDLQVRADNDGRFAIEAVPSGGEGVLLAIDRKGRQVAVPLASIADGEPVTMTFGSAPRWLKLLPNAGQPPLSVMAVNRDGGPCAMTAWLDGQPQLGEFLMPARPTLVRLHQDAVALRISPGTARERRIELEPETTHVHVR